MPGSKDKDVNERQNTPERATEGGTEPKKGGFGQFADKYRERWEAEHPKSAKPGKGGSSPGGTPSNDPANPPRSNEP